MGKFKINADFDKETKIFMKDVINKLSDNDGDIPSDWYAGLNMMAENYNTIIKSNKIIKSEGLMIKNRFGDYISHPLIKVSENAQIQCVKLLNEYGLTKKSAKKVDDVDVDKSDDIVGNFFKGKIEKRSK